MILRSNSALFSVLFAFSVSACGGKHSSNSGHQGSGGSPATGGSGGSLTTGGTGGNSGGAPGTGGSGGSEAGGAAGAAGSGGSQEPPVGCEIGLGDHDSCDGECPIESDYSIRCDDPFFGRLGLQAAATSERLFLAAVGWDETLVWSFGEENAGQLDAWPLEPSSTPIALAVAADDTLYAVGDETMAPSYEGGLAMVTLVGQTLTKSTIYDNPERFTSLNDLVLDSDGVPHVWYLSDASIDEISLSTLDSDGSWQRQVVVPRTTGYERYSLSDTDEPVAFNLEGSNSSSLEQLVVQSDGAKLDLGSAFEPAGIPRFRPIDPPVLRDASSPELDYAAIVQHSQGLSIFWSSEGQLATEELSVPSEPSQCPLGPDFDRDDCPSEPCREQGVSLSYQAFAATRTTSEIWVGYAVQHVDWDVEFARQDIDGQMVCVGNRSEDRTTAELRVVRVPLSADPSQQVLSLPIPSLGFNLPVSADSDSGPVSLHAFGDRLAVGVRSETEEASEYRLLLLDAAP